MSAKNYVDEGYIQSRSREDLATELTIALNRQYALMAALRNLPEVPDVAVMSLLDGASSWSIDKPLGTELQRKHGLDAVPPVSEYESGAGLWCRIRTGLLMERESREKGN